jgi:hypothetical protein
MGGMRLIQLDDIRSFRPNNQLERFRVITKDLMEKALEVLNRISTHELKKSEPEPDLMEDYYLLFHYLDFLKRFASHEA